jgi:hypothetical protein
MLSLRPETPSMSVAFMAYRSGSRGAGCANSGMDDAKPTFTVSPTRFEFAAGSGSRLALRLASTVIVLDRPRQKEKSRPTHVSCIVNVKITTCGLVCHLDASWCLHPAEAMSAVNDPENKLRRMSRVIRLKRS